MTNTRRVITGSLTVALVCSTALSSFAQTPAAANNVPDTTSAKTRQRFASKTAGEKPAESRPADSVKRQGKHGSEPEATATPEPTVAPVTKPTNASLDEALTSDKQQAQSLDDVLVANPAADAKSDKTTQTSDVPADTQANRHEQASEEAAIVPYYNNFFNTYRLGPEDVISVNVFGQDRYSRSGIVIPPSGRISMSLIPGGVFVNGKTVEEVAEAIKKSYDEYIIDPQVSVSLDKASSYRYSVIGDVGQPGIRLMTHRMTVTEALGEAGGVLATGDRSRVMVLRRQADGHLIPIAVNVSAIYKGKAADITYLVPGDQVIVPGNKLKSFQKIMTFFPVLSFARIFTGGIFP
ncbi:MAG TPA: polysaccharide biosynthesis/export family protein [Pyrinomonadaceae bacterium]|nr:polysaccharide biosynthesis/export family protein [Pyrinomonadaceae bacterium]